MNRLTLHQPVPAKKARPPSRLASLLDFILRHGGAVSVDHVHILPLDRVDGRTGAVTPRIGRRRCY